MSCCLLTVTSLSGVILHQCVCLLNRDGSVMKDFCLFVMTKLVVEFGIPCWRNMAFVIVLPVNCAHFCVLQRMLINQLIHLYNN